MSEYGREAGINFNALIAGISNYAVSFNAFRDNYCRGTL